MDATELAALRTLCERPHWGMEHDHWDMDEVPARIGIDVLRALDQQGFIEARYVLMPRSGERRDGPRQPEPHEWYSPIKSPGVGGDWNRVFNHRKREEVFHPFQIHVTDAGRAESGRWTREQVRPLINRVDDLCGTPAIRREFVERADEIMSIPLSEFCKAFPTIGTRLAAVDRPERVVFCYALLAALHDSVLTSVDIFPKGYLGAAYSITRIGNGELRRDHVETALRVVEQDLSRRQLMPEVGQAPSPSAAPPDPEASPDLGSMPDAFMSEADLAKHAKVNQGSLRRVLRNWRPQHMNNDWLQVPNPRPRDPKYLYRVGSVFPVLRRLGWTGTWPGADRPDAENA